jgi:molecular chaperone DnaK (HSP70)
MNFSALSIDFGNTNTVVYAQSHDGTLSALAIPAISVSDVLLSENTTDRAITTIPTEVYLGDDRAFIGKQAFREVDKCHSNAAYSKYAINFKKSLLNLYAADCEERESRQRELLRYGAAYLSTLCNYIKNEIGMNLDGTEKIPSITLTVPVSAPLEYRSWLKETILGNLQADSITVLDEATCAAFFYNESLLAGDTILVVDIGGSTTDFSLIEICRMTDGTPASRILARNGLRAGGADIDRLIADYIIEKNELEPLTVYSLKSQTRILRLAEKAKKVLTSSERFVDELYDPDLGTSISFILSKDELEEILSGSDFSRNLYDFFAQCKKLVDESGFPSDEINYAAFIGGSFIQPFLKRVVSDALEDAELPSPQQSNIRGEEIFYAVASGAIKLTGVKLEGQCLLNSIFLRTGPAQEVNFKLLFSKGDHYPSSSKDFALGKVDDIQTHFKFWLAELDSYQDLGTGAIYRPITYNGSFYRMKLPDDALAGDHRFITRFHIDDELKVSVSMFDEAYGVNIYSRLEIGNCRSDLVFLDNSSTDSSFASTSTGEILDVNNGRDKVLLSDDRFDDQAVGARPTSVMGKKFSETQLIYSNPDNKFEALVENTILSWSLKGWLVTGCTIPGSPWKPDHILVLDNGVIVVIEDKNYLGEWVGAENGPWRANGQRIRCGSTRGVEDENPLVEVSKCFWAARGRADRLGIESDPFALRVVVAPNLANIDGVILEKDGRLAKLDDLYNIISWAKRRQDDRIAEGQVKQPFIATEMICDAFGIML